MGRCYVRAYLLMWMFCTVVSSHSKEITPRLRHVVNSLQEQVIALQREQQRNRFVIQALETKLDDQLSLRNDKGSSGTYGSAVVVSTNNPSNQATSQKTSRRTEMSLLDILSPEDRKFGNDRGIRNSSVIIENKEFLEQEKKIPQRAGSSRVVRIVTEDYSSEITEATDVVVLTPSISEEIATSPPAFGTVVEDDVKMISKMASDLEQLRTDVSSPVHLTLDADTKDFFRSELESMRMELQKLRKDVESQKSKFEQQESQFDEMRTGRITTKWLQKTVIDVRKEVSELAAALNISVALREGQMLESSLDTLRSDISNLRSELVHKSAGMSRNAASMDELKSELQEVRAMTSTITTDYQQLTDEVTLLKEEFFTSKISTLSKNIRLWDDPSSLEASGFDEGSGAAAFEASGFSQGRQSYHHHLTEEMESVKENLFKLQQNHNFLNKELHALKHNHSSSQAKMETVQRMISDLDNRTTLIYEDQCMFSKSLDDVRHRLSVTEERTVKNNQNIVNITEAMTGMDKVHSSTIQLFEALEGLEDEFSSNIGELQKEISKFEFNVAQVQGSFDILRHDQSSHYQDLKILKMDLAKLNQEFQTDHYRLTTIQNEFLNRSLQKCVEGGQETLQELKLTNMELQLTRLARREEDSKHQANVMYSKLLQKADKSALQSIEMSYRNIIDDARNASSQLANISLTQLRMKQEMMKFIRQLPTDCSFKSVPNPAKEYLSGVYLIRIPHATYAKEVYCDMDSLSDRRWTLVQRRSDGTEDFSRSWEEYKHGFGKPNGEYWFGNEALHTLTQTRNYTLRIDMWDIFGRYLYAEYGNFKVGSEEEQYRLDVGEYSGNASDSLRHHDKMAFSTHDKDNDASSTHCAMYYSAGWWYQHCQYVNINGRYAIGMTWYDEVNKDWVQLTKVEMKISAVKT